MLESVGREASAGALLEDATGENCVKSIGALFFAGATRKSCKGISGRALSLKVSCLGRSS